MLVGGGLAVVRVKSADAMEARTAIFAKCIDEGETKGKPFVIGWRDVDGRGFDKRNDIFDVLKLRGDGCRGCRASRGNRGGNASRVCSALRDCRVCKGNRGSNGSNGCNACRGYKASRGCRGCRGRNGCGGRMGGMDVWGFCHTKDIRG